jgi:hypothetical protein
MAPDTGAGGPRLLYVCRVRVVRIFLSTPSDTEAERAQIALLVRDINETIQFLAPEREVRLELIHYQTAAYPDIPGSAQETIDHQIPADFDIYLGIMWKRLGTPTRDAPSGTVHEFEQALERRKANGRPVIMFFFCDEDIPLPVTLDEVDQLAGVVEFRQRLASIGYTVSYSSHVGFREAVRPRLLRALADVISGPTGPAAAGPPSPAPDVPSAAERQARQLAARYDETRQAMNPGAARTRALTDVFNQMTNLASSLRPLLARFQGSASAGERLLAIAVLHAFPQVEALGWLAARLDNPVAEAPFVGYQAAVALAQAARSLPPSDAPAVEAALEQALALARRLPSDPDRIRVLEFALQELARRATAGDRVSR